MVINVGRAPSDRRLIEALVGTIETVFPSVFVMDVPNSFNSILYATVQPTDWKNLFDNYVYLEQREDVHPLLLDSIQRAIVNQQPTPSSEMVMTDDRAPIEWMTHSLILNFVLSGGTEELQ